MKMESLLAWQIYQAKFMAVMAMNINSPLTSPKNSQRKHN